MSKTYRFFLREQKGAGFSGSDLVLSDSYESDIFHQLTKVLRVSIKDRVVLLSPGSTREYRYSVISAHKKAVELSFEDEIENQNELPISFRVILCLPNKPDKLSFLIQKMVEVGATDILLVSGENSRFKHEMRIPRLEKIVLEAAEQSERGRLTTISVGGKLDAWLGSLSDAEANTIWVALERAENSDLISALERARLPEISLLIGPEGGFSETEKALIGQKKIHSFSLGKRILRMETAAVVSAGIIAMTLGR